MKIFKNNLNEFKLSRLSLIVQKISFDNLNIILEANIKKLNCIEKTKDIEEFLNFIVLKNNIDFGIVSSTDLFFLMF